MGRGADGQDNLNDALARWLRKGSETLELRAGFPMNQQQLADATGVTSIHVNRVLGTLRRAGLLRIAESEVEVSDMAEFERLGGAYAPGLEAIGEEQPSLTQEVQHRHQIGRRQRETALGAAHAPLRPHN